MSEETKEPESMAPLSVGSKEWLTENRRLQKEYFEEKGITREMLHKFDALLVKSIVGAGGIANWLDELIKEET